MHFRDLNKQYQVLKSQIDFAILEVLCDTNFISGWQVHNLEQRLAHYVGVKHCITCGNGTDALTLSLMAMKIKKGDAVFVPDFTFFATGETVSYEGATPIFVDIDKDTFNISASSLEKTVKKVLEEGKLTPKAVISVDLFGQPADYEALRIITDRYHLIILEDAAQGFGGKIGDQFACSFGDISTTSFFPAKPLGCYGDGGAVFTDNDEWAALIRSFSIHGKGIDKYDNVRIGMNSRLDTIQAAILNVKMDVFEEEIEAINRISKQYTDQLKNYVKTPILLKDYRSSWAQYSICLNNQKERLGLQDHLMKQGIPSMIYYQKPMHLQQAFSKESCLIKHPVTESVCKRVLSLPIHPYLTEKEVEMIIEEVRHFCDS